MCADDMVIFEESGEELQAMLNKTYFYTTNWYLIILHYNIPIKYKNLRRKCVQLWM